MVPTHTHRLPTIKRQATRLYLPKDLYNEVFDMAAKNGVSLNAVFTLAIRMFVDGKITTTGDRP
jgi:hypothetical protein